MYRNVNVFFFLFVGFASFLQLFFLLIFFVIYRSSVLCLDCHELFLSVGLYSFTVEGSTVLEGAFCTLHFDYRSIPLELDV